MTIPNPYEVYLEIGKKRTFAGALHWPGWCRSGRDENAALQALWAYGPRYAAVVEPAGLAFQPPDKPTDFRVMERLEGTATTDFGAPGLPPAYDHTPLPPEEMQRGQALLTACWAAFDAAVQRAGGKELRKGPRGGGRTLEKMTGHIVEAEASYIRKLGGRGQPPKSASPAEQMAHIRQAALAALESAGRGELPAKGPRGGARWPARYFIRRAAWHILDHLWEIEDRVV